MKRIIHGTVAAAAAAALCAGGSGSMASWQGATTTEQTTFTMGELGLTTSPGTWLMDGAAATESSRAVPGSTLRYTQVFTLTLDGDGLAARITLDAGAVSRGDAFEPSGVSLSAPAVPDGDGWLVTQGGDMTLTLEFEWPKGAEIDDAAQGADITIDASELLVVQEVTP